MNARSHRHNCKILRKLFFFLFFFVESTSRIPSKLEFLYNFVLEFLFKLLQTSDSINLVTCYTSERLKFVIKNTLGGTVNCRMMAI